MDVPPQQTVSATATCPSTHPTVTGGGYVVEEAEGDPFMHAVLSAQSDNLWGVAMHNSHPSTTFSFAVLATCMAPMP